jgi:hypothetical protein
VHGVQAVALTQGAMLSTTFPIISNTVYELSFWIQGEGRVSPDPFVVNFAGQTTSFSATTNFPAGRAWTHRSGGAPHSPSNLRGTAPPHSYTRSTILAGTLIQSP